MLRTILATALIATCAAQPVVTDSRKVAYSGIERNGLELFLGIPYGQDTSGINRFKPPKPYVFKPGSTFNATQYGDACPQGPFRRPTITPVTISENCLHLDITRPKHVKNTAKLPVMVYFPGGGFVLGATQATFTAPDGLVLQSQQNGLPIIEVALTYRLGIFGFAKSDALRAKGSENVGLRDQRLALEWVRDNIASFGGDPENVTIFGQSSNGLAVGMQLLAYGGSKKAPFHRAICESQALEPGITANYTIDVMKVVAKGADCSEGVNSAEAIHCLRAVPMDKLLDAQIRLTPGEIGDNLGDVWLPSVDGDFLPEAPSDLIRQKKFTNVPTMIGWCENDMARFIDPSVKTAADTYKMVSAYLRGVTKKNINKLLDLYPVSDFPENKQAGLSSEFYRQSQIIRDVVMVCQPMWFGENVAAAGNDVFLYDWNQTMLGPQLLSESNKTGLGVVHTSEFAYIFGNLSAYDYRPLTFNPTAEDYDLQDRGSRSWSTFANTGKPGIEHHKTFHNFSPAFHGKDVRVFVAGGSKPGLTSIDGCHASKEMKHQKLRERCGFLNSPDMIKQLYY